MEAQRTKTLPSMGWDMRFIMDDREPGRESGLGRRRADKGEDMVLFVVVDQEVW